VLIGGATPLSYQWTFNEQVLPNATGPTLTRSSARLEHAGDYRVIITNPFGTLSSAVAHLDVVVPALPSQDQFAGAVTVQNTLYLLGTGSNSNATRENLEPLHDGKKAVRSVWLAWTAPASGVVSVNTLGSDFDSVLAIYTGTNLSNLTPVESDDDSGTDHTSALSFNAVAGTTYRIAIAGYLATSGNIGFELELTPRRRGDHQLLRAMQHQRHDQDDRGHEHFPDRPLLLHQPEHEQRLLGLSRHHAVMVAVGRAAQ